MKPKLFPSNATSFANMGYGAINAISCLVTEELNGGYSLELVMLNTDPLFDRIEIGSIIAAKPNTSDPVQPFVVETITKELNGEVSIYATHIAQYRSRLIPVRNFTATSLADTISKAFQYSLETNPFSFTTDKSVATSFTIEQPRSFRELMGGKEGSILDKYGGEYYYDNFSIQLLNRRGRDNGVRVFYGKNMTDFTAEDGFDYDDSATGVIPYWYSENDGLVMGDVQYSQYADLYSYHRTILKDYSDRYETKPTKATLNTIAASWINSRGLPVTNIEVAFDQLTTDGKPVALGDTIHIINSVYDVDYTSRIIETEYNVLLERYTNVSVGDKQATINDAISETASVSEPEAKGRKILGFEMVNVSVSSSVAANSTANLTGTMTEVDGAVDYIMIPNRCNYGSFTTNPTRSGTTISCTARNLSSGSHTLAGTVTIIAIA